ncbi:MAG: cytosolic protein [Armatimonadetes bacterium]|nr:cytosolic protein [Armatimonadota bacterium]
MEQEFPTRQEYDAWWKLFLQGFLKEFLELVAPDLHAMIDWDAPVEFVDKELLPISADSRTQRLYVDSLFRVRLRNGQEALALIHIEVQGDPEALFPKRMFRYFARLYLEYDLPIISLAIFSDDNPNWQPDTYEMSLGGCELVFKYRTLKLMNLDRAALEQNSNPASLVLLAFLRARETARNMDLRFESRKHLAILARERGYNEEQLAKLDELLEGIMKLPEFLEKQYEEALEEYKREKKIPFITAAERIGLRRGIAEGFQQGYTIGRQEGLEAGRQEGLEAGRREGLEAGRREGLEAGRREGKEEGLQQGLQQGLLEGLRRSLSRRFQKRFGDAVRDVIDALDAVEDVALLNRIDELDAEDAPLDDIRQQLSAYLNR